MPFCYKMVMPVLSSVFFVEWLLMENHEHIISLVKPSSGSKMAGLLDIFSTYHYCKMMVLLGTRKPLS